MSEENRKKEETMEEPTREMEKETGAETDLPETEPAAEQEEAKKAAEAKEAFGEAAAGFEQCRQQLELLEQEGEKAVEAAFDFMENAFGNGQEMILFVTELTLMTEAVQFFAQHPCERYLQYNQELLIGTRRRELLDELNQ